VSLYNYTLALILSVFGIIAVKVNVVEFLIPITILITALLIYLQLANQVKGEYKLSVFITLFFGIIHGLDFLIILKQFLGFTLIKVITFR
jgi:branched-subunit amino acid permease